MTRIAVVCVAAMCGACGSTTVERTTLAGSAGSPGDGGSAGAAPVVVVSGAGGEVAAPVVAGMGGTEEIGVGGAARAGTSGGGQGGAQGVQTAGGSGSPGGEAGAVTVAQAGGFGLPGTGGAAAPCECSSGGCCDGCHLLGPEIICFEGTWQFCEADTTHCFESAVSIATMWARIQCTGLSPQCVRAPPFYEQSTAYSCCDGGTVCQQFGEYASFEPEHPPDPLPYIECI